MLFEQVAGGDVDARANELRDPPVGTGHRETPIQNPPDFTIRANHAVFVGKRPAVLRLDEDAERDPKLPRPSG